MTAGAPKGRPFRGPSGFTLIEILVALAIVGIVMLTAFGALSAVNRTTATIERRLDAVARARAGLFRLVSDLEALHVTASADYRVPGIGDDPDPYRVFCGNSPDDPPDFQRLAFAARAHLPLSAGPSPVSTSGLARITYFVRRLEDGYALVRADVPDLLASMSGTVPSAVVCERVKSLHFRLVDSQGTAQENWDSDDGHWGWATPRAIQIRLEVKDGDGAMRFETLVPIRVGREPRSS